MQRNEQRQPPARIRIVGLGSGGRTAINDLKAGGVGGVDYVVMDTDPKSEKKLSGVPFLQLGQKPLGPYGAGGDAGFGRRAAQSSAGAIRSFLRGSDLVFLIAGMGGGTGTGAAPLVAQIGKELGAVVMGIVTYPSSAEDVRRHQMADQGLSQLRESADTVVVIPIDRLLALADGAVGIHEAYRLAYQIWRQSIQGVSDILNHPGLINVDFADVQAIMREGAVAVVTTGFAKGQGRARKAAQEATHSDLLGISIHGAQGLLINVAGGADLRLDEVKDAATLIGQTALDNANVIIGAAIKDSLASAVHITVIATGFRFQPPGNRWLRDPAPSRSLPRVTPLSS